MSALKQAIWTRHSALENKLMGQDRFGDLISYKDHLARLWSFYAAAEMHWPEYLKPVLDDLPLRLKAPLLSCDVHALGGVLPAPATIPMFTDAASALGGWYVLEGATLGGQHILPRMGKLGLTPGHGASFLASYGSDVRTMWQKFGAAVEAFCDSPEKIERAAQAARLTFDAMGETLTR